MAHFLSSPFYCAARAPSAQIRQRLSSRTRPFDGHFFVLLAAKHTNTFEASRRAVPFVLGADRCDHLSNHAARLAGVHVIFPNPIGWRHHVNATNENVILVPASGY